MFDISSVQRENYDDVVVQMEALPPPFTFTFTLYFTFTLSDGRRATAHGTAGQKLSEK